MRLPKLRIHTLLTGVLFAFALLPTLLLGFLILYLFSSEVTRGYTENLKSAVSLEAESLKSFFSIREQQLKAMTEVPLIKDLLKTRQQDTSGIYSDYQRVHNYFTESIKNIDFMMMIQLVDADNNVVVSNDTAIEKQPTTLAVKVSALPQTSLYITELCREQHASNMPPHFSIAVPIVESGKVTGAIVQVLNLNVLTPIVQGATFFETGTLSLFDDHGTIVTSSDPDFDSKNSSMQTLQKAYATRDLTLGEQGWLHFSENGKAKTAFYSIIPGTRWGLVSSSEAGDMTRTRNDVIQWLIIAVVAGLPFMMLTTWGVSRYLLGDVNSILRTIREFRAGYLPDSNNAPLRTELGIIDTALRELMEALAQSNEEKLVAERQFRLALEQTHQLVFEADITHKRILSGQEHWGRIFTTPFDTEYDISLRRACNDSLHPCDKDLMYRSFCTANVIAHSNCRLDELVVEFRRMDDNGAYIWYSCTLYPMRHKNVLRAIICIKNIHDRKLRELAMAWQARKDSLTGLYNKGATEQAIAEILAGSPQQMSHALYIVDIDNFKSVNDTLGHQVGDAFLREFAELLQSIFRESDIVGRMGGDEFMVLLKDYHEMELVTQKADDLMRRSEKLFASFLAGLNSPPLDVGISIGIALSSDHNEFTRLFSVADSALYKAKRNGKHHWQLS